MSPKFRCTFKTSRTFVSLEDQEEVFDELSSFSHQVLFVKMNQEISFIFSQFNPHKVSLLVLNQILSETIGSLSVCLPPFISFGIVKVETCNTFSELLHHIYPEHGVNLIFLDTEKSVDFGKGSQEEPDCISTAFFKTGSDGTESCVPAFTLLVAALKCLSIVRIDERWSGLSFFSENKLSSSMAKKFVTGNVELVALDNVI
jgi:hypothetical protein